MRNILLLVVLIVYSCSKEDEGVFTNLDEYIGLNTLDNNANVIACAASDKENTDKIYIFFYPVPGAIEVKYFETEKLIEDKYNLQSYKEVDLDMEPVFNGYLERFVKEISDEVWCIVTYKIKGVLRKSEPIRLKHNSKPTEWVDNVTIDFTESTKPKFSWEDGSVKENAIYFQVITDENNNFLSGTYTYDRWFEYYNLDNVVLNITRESPPSLLLNNSYSFTMMGVSLDNWVNLVIQKDFLIAN